MRPLACPYAARQQRGGCSETNGGGKAQGRPCEREAEGACRCGTHAASDARQVLVRLSHRISQYPLLIERQPPVRHAERPPASGAASASLELSRGRNQMLINGTGAGTAGSGAAAAPGIKSREEVAVAKNQPNPNVVKSHPNINECSAHDLRKIKGIGEDTAERIVEFRQQHGRIENAGQLKRLGHFDDETLRKLQEGVTFH